MNTLTPLPYYAPQVIQTVSGKGNMVAGRDLNIRTERVVRKTVDHQETDPIPEGTDAARSSALLCYDP